MRERFLADVGDAMRNLVVPDLASWILYEIRSLTIEQDAGIALVVQIVRVHFNLHEAIADSKGRVADARNVGRDKRIGKHGTFIKCIGSKLHQALRKLDARQPSAIRESRVTY